MQMHYEHQPRVQGLILSRWSMYSLQVTLHKSRFVVDNHSDIPHAVHANRGTGARNTCGMNDGQRCQRGWEIMDREPCLTEHLPYISTGFGLSSCMDNHIQDNIYYDTGSDFRCKDTNNS